MRNIDPFGKVGKVTSSFPQEVVSDTKRISGVTPSVTKPFESQPWRFLPKRSMTLKQMALSGSPKRKGSVL